MHRTIVALVALVAPGALVVAVADCSSSSGSASGATSDAGADVTAFDAPSDTPLDVDPALRAAAQSACAAEGQAYCARAASCFADFVPETFGDEATCAARLALGCVPTVLSAGSQTTPADVRACTTAIATADCDALFVDNAPPPACQTIAGTLPTHAKCAFSAQCVGALCIPGASGCGVCVSADEAGADCVASNDCGYGLVCASGACVAPAGEAGAPCTATQPCDAPFVCDTGLLRCVAPLDAGALCDPSSPIPCDTTQGIVCVPGPDPLAGGACMASTLVASGACGLVGSGFVACSAGGVCANVDANGQGTCVPAAADGAPCDATSGPLCLPPALCVAGSCVVDDENSCR